MPLSNDDNVGTFEQTRTKHFWLMLFFYFFVLGVGVRMVQDAPHHKRIIHMYVHFSLLKSCQKRIQLKSKFDRPFSSRMFSIYMNISTFSPLQSCIDQFVPHSNRNKLPIFFSSPHNELSYYKNCK